MNYKQLKEDVKKYFKITPPEEIKRVLDEVNEMYKKQIPPNMKEFRIIESRPATYYWEYIVVAENAGAALDKILNGEEEATETWCEEDEGEDSDFEIYESEQ